MNKKRILGIFAAAAMFLGVTTAFAEESFSEILNESILTLPQGPITNISTKENFRQRAAQMGTEMKVIPEFQPEGEIEIFVSPEGNDLSGRGTIDNPYQTLQAALKKVADMTYDEKLGGIVIWLRDGNYSTSETIALDARHSGDENAPLYISAYNDEDVTFSGAAMVRLSDFAPITDEAKKNKLYEKVRDKVLVCDLKAHGITEYGRLHFVGEKTGEYSDLYESQTNKEPNLYFDAEKLTLARYPNGESLRVGKAIDNGNMDSTGCITSASDDGRGFEFVMADDVPFRWENTGQIALRGFFSFGYAPEYSRVRKFNKETNSVRSVGKLWRWPIRQTSETVYYFANVFEELDMPGEWFLDRTDGKLYLYPLEGYDDATIFLSINTNNIFSATNAKNVVFNKIKVKNTPSISFSIKDCERVVVQNCDMVNITEGVSLSGSKYSGVTYSYIKGFTSRGVTVGGKSQTEYWNYALENMELEPWYNFVQNNYICGNDDLTSADHFRGGGIGTVVSHNLFQNGFNGTLRPSGIYIITEYNEIVGGDKRISDYAPLYTGGVYASYLVQRYNYMHDNSLKGNNLGRGFYFDEGGSWFECYGNILEEQEEGVYSHSGKSGVSFNNLFINCKKNVVTSTNHISHLYDWVRPEYYKDSFWSGWFANLNRKNYYDLYHLPYSTMFPEQQELTDHFWEWQEWAYSLTTEERMSLPLEEEHEKWLLSPLNYYVANNMSTNNTTVEASIHKASHETSEIENNYSGLTEESFADFENHNYTIVDEKALAAVPDWIQIPMDKIGFTDGTRWDNIKLGEIGVTTPLAGYENRVNAAKIVFDWNQVEFAEYYRLIIAKDGIFIHGGDEHIVQDNFILNTVEPLGNATDYALNQIHDKQMQNMYLKDGATIKDYIESGFNTTDAWSVRYNTALSGEYEAIIAAQECFAGLGTEEEAVEKIKAVIMKKFNNPSLSYEDITGYTEVKPCVDVLVDHNCYYLDNKMVNCTQKAAYATNVGMNNTETGNTETTGDTGTVLAEIEYFDKIGLTEEQPANNEKPVLYLENDTKAYRDEFSGISWSSVDNAVYYVVEIAKDAQFNDVVVEADTLLSEYAFYKYTCSGVGQPVKKTQQYKYNDTESTDFVNSKGCCKIL